MATRAMSSTQRRRSTTGTTSTRRKPARRSTRRAAAPKAPRLGPLFFTIVAVTGLCALAFLGLVASVVAGS